MIISVKAHLLLILSSFLVAFLPSSGSAQLTPAPYCLYEAPVSFFAPAAALNVAEATPSEPACPLGEEGAAEPSTHLARCWFDSAEGANEDGDHAGATAYMLRLAAAYPELRDRFALIRGQWALERGEAELARSAFSLARASTPDSTTKLQAEIGLIRTEALTHPSRAKASLTSLLRRFPRLPDRNNLRLEIAAAHAEQGDDSRAVTIYQQLDRDAPGSAAAAVARKQLTLLAEGDTRIPRYSGEQEIRRIEAWMRSGPFSEARDAMVSLRERQVRLSSDQRARLSLMEARLARIEGRFSDASRLLNQGRSASTLDTEQRERVTNRAQDMAAAARGMTAERARSQIQRIRRGRPLLRLRAPQLMRILDLAVDGGLEAEATRALTLLPRKSISDEGLFKAAIRSMGVATAEATRATLQRLAESGRIDARYHYARILERSGELEAARARYEAVAQDDRSPERYYAMWATLRLRSAEGSSSAEGSGSAEGSSSAEGSGSVGVPTGAETLLASSDNAILAGANSPEQRCGEGLLPAGTTLPPHNAPEIDLEALAERLAPVATTHAEAYPWLKRAHSLLLLQQPRAAADELTEALIAWREAAGRPLRRMGLEAVSRGTERARVRLDRDLRRDRRTLDNSARQTVAHIAMSLGDAGTYVALTGWHAADERPRAYEGLVVEAAQRHGVDPNLLLAVMRVESVFQSRIVSYAGAVGLMQIMPRTGENIAHAVGVDEFTPEDLLKPETNIDFAAWYLASLIERFDGRLPLAIASYNGGPHNVRRWIAGRRERMPLDAMLELIPFGQTHRYVRRVLTHYEAYRAQQSLPMTALSTELPVVGVDNLAF